MSRRYPAQPLVGVALVVFDGERVLLVERARPPALGQWTVPGGLVEVGETIAEAALRELAEETGLVVDVGPIVEVVERILRDGDGRAEYHYVIVDLLGTAPRGELRAGSDSSQVRWVAPSELTELPLTEGLLPVIEKARRLAEAG